MRRYATILVLAFYLALTAGLGIVTAASSHAMPACCWAPENRWDERCVGARFQYPPGYNFDNPGTWGNYSPWQGQCNSLPGIDQNAYRGGGFTLAAKTTDLPCRDVQTSWVTSHICRNPDGTITSCVMGVCGIPMNPDVLPPYMRP